MNWKQYIQKIWYKLIYVIVCIIYLIKLNILNQELLSMQFDSPFHLLVYNHSIALWYFLIALALWIWGVIMIIESIKELRYVDWNVEEIVIPVLTIIISIALIIAIFVGIDNPILKAVLICVLFALGIIEKR